MRKKKPVTWFRLSSYDKEFDFVIWFIKKDWFYL
jgi:hypothetical protein